MKDRRSVQSRSGVAVIFDMDGVIVDNMPFHSKAWEMFFAKYHPAMPLEEFLPHLGKPNADLLRLLFGSGISESEILSLSDEKEALYREIYAPEIKPVPGIVVFLKSLKEEGVKTAVATAAPRVNLDFLFDHLDLRSFFTISIDVSEVKRGKPDPEIYLEAAERLGCTPQSCLVFEDSLAGIRAARNAGMKVVGVATTNPPEMLSDTDLIIRDFTGMTYEKVLSLVGRFG